jgi:hypothetical protein
MSMSHVVFAHSLAQLCTAPEADRTASHSLIAVQCSAMQCRSKRYKRTQGDPTHESTFPRESYP